MPVDLKFTSGDDNYSRSEVFLYSSEKLQSLEGNDEIIAIQPIGNGIYNAGTIDTGAGDDLVANIDFSGLDNTSTSIFNTGSILLGTGNDTIKASMQGGNAAIYIQRDVPDKKLGLIDTGDGNDTVYGQSSSTGIINEGGIITTGEGDDEVVGVGGKSAGVINMQRYNKSNVLEKGLINLGNGDNILSGQGNTGIVNNGNIIGGTDKDLITGTASGSLTGYNAGIYNGGTTDNKGNWIANSNSILTGSGNDEIIGHGERGIMNTSLIDTGDGSDTIFGEGLFIGIENWADIKTGSGNDNIISKGGNAGIINNGLIDTGDDNDIVNALEGGFFYESDKYEFPLVPQRGIWTLGSGDDLLLGFGTGNFFGGEGTDSVRLSEGIYTVTGNQLSKKNRWNQNISMLLVGFELIGGIKGDLQKYKDGSLIIDSTGNILSASASYKTSTSIANIGEGGRFTTTISTSGVALGSIVYYELSGNGITTLDFSSGFSTGSGTVDSDGKMSFFHTIAEDATTEGDETLEIKLYSDSARKVQVGSTASIKVIDTSLSPTKPTQQIYTEKSQISYKPTGTVSAPLLYTTSSGDAKLSGLTLNVHYNSSILTPTGSSNGVTAQLPAAVTSTTIMPDANNSDNDALTDKIIQLVWATFDSSFPNKTLPAPLATISFNTAATTKDPLTGQPLTTTVRYTASESAAGYDFLTGFTTFKAQSFNLDVDGDGKVTALGDGLMVIRKLFGAAFAGDSLTYKAMSPNATRTTVEIHDFLQQGIDGGMLDVDKDGKTTALGDGLIVIRRLFGAAFDGAALTNKAISPNSPYFGQSNDFNSIGINIDALKPTVI